MLISNGASNGFERGALKFGPRKAWEFAGIGKLTDGPVALGVQGREDEVGWNFTDFDPGQVYTWRIDWGPDAGAQTARVFLDGIERMQLRYNRPYQPNTHLIELGLEERGESVIDAVYRNFVVVRRN